MDYLAWNNAIGEHFLNPDRAGHRVFLYITTDVIAGIGARYGVDLADFILAVKTGPPWNTRQARGICQQALQALDNWRKRDLNYPPYLAYLALFVLADSEVVDGFSRYSYYPGLRQLLGEVPAAGGYASFDQMYALWFDLEDWSNQDKDGEFGIFTADILGKREYVGLPKAQMILTDDERNKLPLLFAENGFDSSSPPTDRELSHLLSRETHHYLLPHTKRLLRSLHDKENAACAVLLDAILEELYNWDGTIPVHTELGEQKRSTLGNLRLAMMIDKTSQTVSFALRCRSNREYPEEGLRLKGESIGHHLYCFPDLLGWSTSLSMDESQFNIFNPAELDWLNGFTLSDSEHSWNTVFHKRSIKVLTSAMALGFDGFIEQTQLPQGKPFYLLVHEEHSEAITRWGIESCEGFCEFNATSGLPIGWHIYSIDHARSDSQIRDAFPFLAFPTVLRIQLRGGLKVKGNQYFAFALPQVELSGAVEGLLVFCNDHQLEFNAETQAYRIPDSLTARRLVIEVKRSNECIRSKSIYTLETVAWRNVMSETYFDKFGQRTLNEVTEKSTGTIVQGIVPPEFIAEVFLPPSTGNRVYFVGRNPGEIVICPQETLSDMWQPIWAIPMQKRGKGTAVYCGRDPTSETPCTQRCDNRKRLRIWRDILWYSRKRITHPSHPLLRDLWRRYIEVAHHGR
jgi:hypothetical protein